MLGTSGISAGYFDSWDAALQAVEKETGLYKAVWFSLNPVKLPDGIPVNPPALSRVSHTADVSDIARRVWLLVDVDSPHPPDSNSTDSEKQLAREQAKSVREYLRGRNWPEPMLCDSGNGWHLLYAIDLPNDDSATELVRGVLARLKQQFPMVDAVNFNANRVTKFYGSMTRKGPNSEERPWRPSVIVEEGSGIAVTAEQLRSLAGDSEGGVKREGGGKGLVVEDRTGLDYLLGFLEYYDIPLKTDPEAVKGEWRIGIECPWQHEHSSGESDRETAVSFIGKFGFHCFHSHCDRRNWDALRAEMEHRHTDKPPFFGSLPPITHGTLAEAFLKANDDFLAVYDAPGRPIAQWVHTRWDSRPTGFSILGVVDFVPVKAQRTTGVIKQQESLRI